MRGSRNLAEIAQQLNIGRQVAERIIANQATIWLPAELPKLLFVDLLEKGALIPGRIGILPQMPIQFAL